MTGSPALLALRNTVENTGASPIADEEIVAILAGHGGRAAHVRAIFEDNSLQALAKAGAAFGIPVPVIMAAYGAARSRGVVNVELDRLIADPW